VHLFTGNDSRLRSVAQGSKGFPPRYDAKQLGKLQRNEDRGSQITFSALGQQAPLEEKKKWDPDFTKRKKIKAILDPLIPGFSVRLGGERSVDVTKPGIDKAYGIKKLRDLLGISLQEMIFVGDALFVGGNDYPAKEAGVVSIPVRGPSETKPVTKQSSPA
jgi:phosphomannomutase